MVEFAGEIRGVLIPIQGIRILLPNAAVAEVITYSEPPAIKGSPDWVLGHLPWRGWNVPVFSFAMMASLAKEEPTAGAKVAVLKAVGGNAKMPYIAMITQGFPRLFTVSKDSTALVDSNEKLPMGVHSYVNVDGDDAIVPALDEIEETLFKALDV